MPITKHDLILTVSKAMGLTQADTKIGIEQLLETISKILETGTHIELRGLGLFIQKSANPGQPAIPKPARLYLCRGVWCHFLNIATSLKGRLRRG